MKIIDNLNIIPVGWRKFTFISYKMAVKKAEFSCEQDSVFLQENRQRLVKSIADQIYNTIVTKSSCETGKS